jgi:TolB-like protein
MVKIIILLLSLSLFSQENIAVLDLDADGVTASEARTLTNKLRGELINTGKFTVIERSEMDDVLKEQGFQSTGCTSQECAVEMGQLLGVERMVAGSIGKVGNIYLISLRLIDVGKGNILKNIDEEVEGDISLVLRSGMGKAAKKLAGVEATSIISPREVIVSNTAKPIKPKTNSRKLFCIDIGSNSYEGKTFSWSEVNRFSEVYSDLEWNSGVHIGIRYSLKNIYKNQEGRNSIMIGCSDLGITYEKNRSSEKIISVFDSIIGTNPYKSTDSTLVYNKVTLYDNITIAYRIVGKHFELEPYSGVCLAVDLGGLSGTLIESRTESTLKKAVPRLAIPIGIRIYKGKIFFGFEYSFTKGVLHTATDPSFNKTTGENINGDLSFERASHWAIQLGVITGN